MCELLNDPIADSKTYWKLINRYLSNENIPAIPPLLVNGEIISNFTQTASIFNKFFASQCTPLQIHAVYLSFIREQMRVFRCWIRRHFCYY